MKTKCNRAPCSPVLSMAAASRTIVPLAIVPVGGGDGDHHIGEFVEMMLEFIEEFVIGGTELEGLFSILEGNVMSADDHHGDK